MMREFKIKILEVQIMATNEFGATIAERLHRAALAMPDVAKTGKNAQFNYDYLEDKQLTSIARMVLLDNGIVIIQSLESVEQKPHQTERSLRFATLAKWKFKILAPGLMEIIEVPWTSESMDSGDKGISKCTTMARKDFFRTLLMVPGGAENEADKDEPISSGIAKYHQTK